MKMEVQIVSQENVKPSCPTPQHLKTFKLSLLDQFMPSPYAPIVLFYPMNENNSHSDVTKRLELVKKSLSETLSRFYPLAGKIKDDLSIECNDEGAYYLETRVNCHLNEFLRKPDLLLINRFLPCEFFSKESSAGTYVTNIQANVFECGGIVIGICISHKILDGAALSTFIKEWAATARGSREAVYPDFIASSLFPADNLWLRDSSIVLWGSMFKKGKCITRRFVFDGSAISNLRVQVTGSDVKCPTRVEVVSAFLWKYTMSASEEIHGYKRPSLLTHLVNLRRRTSLPSLENSIGNLMWIAAAQSLAESRRELSDLVGEVRKTISKIDDEFVMQIKGDYKRNATMSKSLKEIGELGSTDGVDHLGFSSWCKFGFYDADFGWGKPVWVSSIGLEGSVFMNLVILVDTRLGDGIEAWVTLDEQEMAILQGNPELLKFASLDPSLS